jgi:hypothetical protein
MFILGFLTGVIVLILMFTACVFLEDLLTGDLGGL